MRILIKTFSGMAQRHSFDVEPSMTIRELKHCIGTKTGDDDDTMHKMILSCNGKILYHPNKTLQYYHIEENSKIELHDLSDDYRDLTSLGIKFVDVSNSKALERCAWSNKAPLWRMAPPGLCLEGICGNRDCDAFKQQVIIGIGYGKFDLVNDSDETTMQCPICEQYVEPKTCGFNNCWWRFEGKKSEHGKAPKACKSDWQGADDAYHYFEDANNNMVNWRQLIIEAVEENPKEMK